MHYLTYVSCAYGYSKHWPRIPAALGSPVRLGGHPESSWWLIRQL